MTKEENQAVTRSPEEADELYSLTLRFLHSKAWVITISGNKDQKELKKKTRRISMKAQKYFAVGEGYGFTTGNRQREMIRKLDLC